MKTGLYRHVFHPSSFLSRYGPVVLWVGFIFFASTGNLSASNTSRIIRPLLLWLFPDISDLTLIQVHFLVRKTAHFTEYAILAVVAARAFLTSLNETIRRNWYWSCFALVAACALLDEYHQSFLETRSGSVYDSVIDMVGGATAIAVISMVRFFGRRRGNETEPHKRQRRSYRFSRE